MLMCVCVCVCVCVSQTLLSWNASAAEEALSIFKTEALNAMAKLNGGYVVSSSGNLGTFNLPFPCAFQCIQLHRARSTFLVSMALSAACFCLLPLPVLGERHAVTSNE